VALWLLSKIPMDAQISQILHWVIVAIVVIVVVLWFFSLFGVSLQTLNRPMRIG
jgi:small-conductance mechanosensitive channel